MGMKFKVGDKVKIVGPVRTGQGKIGDVGHVDETIVKGNLINRYTHDYVGNLFLVNGSWYGEDALEVVGMKDVGTLKELGVCVGDVVEYVSGSYSHDIRIGEKYTCENSKDGLLVRSGNGGFNWVHSCVWIHKIVSRAPQTPKLWRDMTAEEKGALLLAAHEGKVIEFTATHNGKWRADKPGWYGNLYYRIKPEPKVETVTRDIWMDRLGWLYEDITCHHPVRVTFKTVDGVIDVSTYKVEPR